MASASEDRRAADGRLDALGLRAAEAVRWREAAGGGWRHGTVRGGERDGSIGVTADGGAARSLPVDRLWVVATGRRGGIRWEPLTARAARSEQLSLLALLAPDDDGTKGSLARRVARRSG